MWWQVTVKSVSSWQFNKAGAKLKTVQLKSISRPLLKRAASFQGFFYGLQGLFKGAFMLAPAVVAKRLVMQLQILCISSPAMCCGTKICACLSPPKWFLLSYALNWKAAVIWCNLGGINSPLFPFLCILPLSLFECSSSVHFPLLYGCLRKLAIRGLGAILLIRLRNLPPSTTNLCVLGERREKGALGNVMSYNT